MTADRHGSGSYVLHAMDSGERRDFEDELLDSEELRNEVTELTDTAVLLGLALPAIEPAPALKQSIMARIAQLPQLAAEVDEDDDENDFLAPVTPLRAGIPNGPVRWYSRPVALVAAAAAAIVLVVGGVVGAGLVASNVATSQQASAYAAISSAPDAQRAVASVSTGGTATLVWSQSHHKSALVAKGMRSLPSGKTYELWYISQSGTVASAGLFTPSGARTVSILTGRMKAGDTIGITIEPAGGSTQPTTKPIVAIQTP